MLTVCPCGSNTNYDQCCGRYIEQQLAPPSAEALMRSRYTAYTLKNQRYLLASWHPTTRPEQLLHLDTEEVSWQKLKILRLQQGTTTDLTGRVAFIASYLSNNEQHTLCEDSKFERIDGQWYYLDGDMLSVSKNGPCPCDSGKKFKRCCGK